MPFPTFCSCIRFPSGGMAVAYRGSASGRTYFLEKKLAKARESLYIRRTSLQVGRFPSGQRGQTVNLLAFAFEGSNPSLPTTFTFITRSPEERVFYCFRGCGFVMFNGKRESPPCRRSRKRACARRMGRRMTCSAYRQGAQDMLDILSCRFFISAVY